MKMPTIRRMWIFYKRDVLREVGVTRRGVLRTSPAIGERLARAEDELSKLQAASAPRETLKVDRILPRVIDGYREMVADLPNALNRDPAKARAGIRRMLGGQIKVEVSATEARFLTQKGRAEAAFLRAAGAGPASQTTLVAGACFRLGSH